MKESLQTGFLKDGEVLIGNTLGSFETTTEESGIQAYIQEHFDAFLAYSVALSPFDRQILIEYYHLGKTEEQLAIVHNLSQPTIFRALQAAAVALGTVISGGKPSPKRRKPSGPLDFRESEQIGQFVVDLERRDLDHIFSPHAVPRCS